MRGILMRMMCNESEKNNQYAINPIHPTGHMFDILPVHNRSCRSYLSPSLFLYLFSLGTRIHLASEKKGIFGGNLTWQPPSQVQGLAAEAKGDTTHPYK